MFLRIIITNNCNNLYKQLNNPPAMEREKTRTSPLESLFRTKGTLEEVDKLRRTIKDLPENCFDYINEDRAQFNQVSGNGESVFLEVYGAFRVPEGATDIVIEETSNIGSRAQFTYKNQKYSVATNH